MWPAISAVANISFLTLWSPKYVELPAKNAVPDGPNSKTIGPASISSPTKQVLSQYSFNPDITPSFQNKAFNCWYCVFYMMMHQLKVLILH